MPQEGYADPITNDGPGFHSIIPISKLTEHVTQARAIEARDVSSAPSVVRNRGWGNAQNSNQPLSGPKMAQGLKTPKTTSAAWAAPTLGSMSSTSPDP